MKSKLVGILSVVVVLMVGAVPGFAHHGFAVEFDSTRCMDLKGTLTGVDWENPHAYFHMDVKNADGKVESWSLETISPNSMKRSGTTRQDFLNSVGKTVATRACPTKPGGTPYRGTAEILRLVDGQPRIVGQNVENWTDEQIRTKTPQLGNN
jgi:hypothetical protein